MSPPLEPHDYIGLSAAAPAPTSSSSSSSTEGPRLTLRLGLPGSESPDRDRDRDGSAEDVAPALTLGPVPIPHKAASKRAFPDASKTKGGDDAAPHYVKVSMDGAPYLRKVDLKTYSSYEDLSMALQKMFSCFITGQSALRKPSTKDRLTSRSNADSLQDQEYVLTYEDKDADWMLVGDLPWDLFTTICRKLKIMRGSDAAGIAPRSLEQTGQNK